MSKLVEWWRMPAMASYFGSGVVSEQFTGYGEDDKLQPSNPIGMVETKQGMAMVDEGERMQKLGNGNINVIPAPQSKLRDIKAKTGMRSFQEGGLYEPMSIPPKPGSLVKSDKPGSLPKSDKPGSLPKSKITENDINKSPVDININPVKPIIDNTSGINISPVNPVIGSSGGIAMDPVNPNVAPVGNSSGGIAIDPVNPNVAPIGSSSGGINIEPVKPVIAPVSGTPPNINIAPVSPAITPPVAPVPVQKEKTQSEKDIEAAQAKLRGVMEGTDPFFQAQKNIMTQDLSGAGAAATAALKQQAAAAGMSPDQIASMGETRQRDVEGGVARAVGDLAKEQSGMSIAAAKDLASIGLQGKGLELQEKVNQQNFELAVQRLGLDKDIFNWEKLKNDDSKKMELVNGLLKQGGAENFATANSILQGMFGTTIDFSNALKQENITKFNEGMAQLTKFLSSGLEWEAALAAMQKDGSLEKLGMTTGDIKAMYQQMKLNASPLFQTKKSIDDMIKNGVLTEQQGKDMMDFVVWQMSNPGGTNVSDSYAIYDKNGVQVANFKTQQEADDYIKKNPDAGYQWKIKKFGWLEINTGGDTPTPTPKKWEAMSTAEKWKEFEKSQEGIPDDKKIKYDDWVKKGSKNYDEYIKGFDVSGDDVWKTTVSITDKERQDVKNTGVNFFYKLHDDDSKVIYSLNNYSDKEQQSLKKGMLENNPNVKSAYGIKGTVQTSISKAFEKSLKGKTFDLSDYDEYPELSSISIKDGYKMKGKLFVVEDEKGNKTTWVADNVALDQKYNTGFIVFKTVGETPPREEKRRIEFNESFDEFKKQHPEYFT